MSDISDYPLSFSLVRNYIVFAFKRYYGEYIVLGRENIPTDSPVIFAPNHINALMDAIAIHSIAPYKKPVIFLARSDVFKNKTAAKILKFAKILPAFRMRDGMENLGKNNQVFEECVEILGKNSALGIMPEGDQGEQRKLRPLVKGIFRIAFATQQHYGSQKKVNIIPVGIDYGDLVKFGKHIIINIGKPIELTDYMTSYAENPVTATNEIKERLLIDLNKLSLNLSTNNHYECFETVVEVANSKFEKKSDYQDKTLFRFIARQEISKRLVALEKTEPEKIEMLDSVCKEYSTLLKKLKLKNWVLEQGTPKTIRLIINGLNLFFTLPFFIYGFLFNFLPFFVPVFIRKYIIKPEYEGFYSSLQFVMGVLTFPLFYILQTVIFSLLTGSPLWVSSVFFVLQYPLGKSALKWYNEIKKYNALLRYRNMIQKKSSELFQSQNLREQIIRMIS